MGNAIPAQCAHDLQSPESPGVPTAYRGQGKGPKKTAETDAIFENVRRVNALADAEPNTLRISMDTKATVHVGDYSRGGRSRGVVAVQAPDHDMCMKEKLVPGGILEPVSGNAFLFFGTTYKTSDVMADGLLLWWQHRRPALRGIEQLVINLDKRTGMQRAAESIPAAHDGVCGYDGALCATGLLPTLSQQIQRRGALLGGTGEIMERLLARYRAYGHRSSREFLLERDAHARTLGGCRLREGCKDWGVAKNETSNTDWSDPPI